MDRFLNSAPAAAVAIALILGFVVVVWLDYHYRDAGDPDVEELCVTIAVLANVAPEPIIEAAKDVCP